MEREVGKVIRIKGDKAEVLLHSSAACGTCGARFSCALGTGVDRIITVTNRFHAKVGDQVEIELTEKTRILSALLVFFMPLVLIVAGYFLGTGIFHTQGSGILGAVLGFIISGVILWMVNKIAIKNQRVNPHMKRLLHQHG